MDTLQQEVCCRYSASLAWCSEVFHHYLWCQQGLSRTFYTLLFWHTTIVTPIFQRLTQYTLACIIFSHLPEDIRHVTLSETLEELNSWNAWDDIATLAHHQTIRKYLLSRLQSITKIRGSQNDPDVRLDSLNHLNELQLKHYPVKGTRSWNNLGMHTQAGCQGLRCAITSNLARSIDIPATCGPMRPGSTVFTQSFTSGMSMYTAVYPYHRKLKTRNSVWVSR